MTNRLLLVLAIVGLAILACSGNIELPQAPTAGPTVVDQISVPVPAGGSTRLVISFGAGELLLSPGASKLVEGTAEYNVEALKPAVVTDGANVEIKQGDLLNLVEPRGVKSKWDFQLGSSPMELSINAGAYQGKFQMGGLSLTGLTIKDGAASVDLDFSQPNPSSMAVFRYETGASQVKMTGLANANFTTMIFNSGAGDYELDFGGDLQRDATITISTGLSNLKLVVPEGVPATVTAETGVSNINVSSSWSQDGNRYTHRGSGPTLTFIVKGGAGNLTLTE
jgi:hypothetical protein